MTELNKFCKFSFGSHIKRETSEDRSHSGGHASDVCGRWDRDNTSRAGIYEPTSYIVGI